MPFWDVLVIKMTKIKTLCMFIPIGMTLYKSNHKKTESAVYPWNASKILGYKNRKLQAM